VCYIFRGGHKCYLHRPIDKICLRFWDDFKYTVVQTAFDADLIQNNKISNSIKDIDPLYQHNDSEEIQNKDTEDKDGECCAMMDRYFFRAPNNPSLEYERLINSILKIKSYNQYILININFL